MVATLSSPSAGSRTADDGLVPGRRLGAVGDMSTTAGMRPGVRVVLTLIVLIPLFATGIVLAASANSAWAARNHALLLAGDARRLQVVAAARAEMNRLQLPLSAVSYAREIGVSEPELDTLLRPAVPFREQVAEQTADINRYPTFSASPTLRADVAALPAVILGMAEGYVTYGEVHDFLAGMASGIDNVWYGDYNRLQSDVAASQPPGAFDVHTAALRQTYQAFLSGGQEIESAVFVLEGIGPTDAKQEVIQAAGEFKTATSEFAGHLSANAQAAWNHILTDSSDQRFSRTIQQGLDVALNATPPPFAGNLAFAGASAAPSLQYLADLDTLVTSASHDLQTAALRQASNATSQLIGELIFLTIVATACVGGVVVAGRFLTRPVKRLAVAATKIERGQFDIDLLPEDGPREVAATTAAFNEMASTLTAIEAKTVALAAEDLSHPELYRPLPGRTGQALQASVDLLATRIRERELQRQLLQEAATHDPLTGLLNRAAVLDYLMHDVARRREAGETVAVLFIDLDGLKPLNDTYGHEVGDTAILRTAMALMVATQPCDVVGRLGGDEFLVVLCHDHSFEGDEVVERIQSKVGECRIPVGQQDVVFQASLGVALTRCDAETDPMVLVRQADEAMYEAKKAARAAREQVNPL
jgi:diguanylate cyclase (GGDEF)-like protein